MDKLVHVINNLYFYSVKSSLFLMYLLLLKKFQPVTLHDIAEVNLMDRNESKYILHAKDLPLFLENLPEDLKILHINEECISNYKTEYFDTIQSTMYLDHHRGKLNRYKIRLRTYTNTQMAFLEIKHKNNKGKTQKKRTATPVGTNLVCETGIHDFIKNNSPFSVGHLHTQIITHYKRITLIDVNNKIRLTIDTQIEFKDKDNQFEMNNLCILEIKKESSAPTHIEKQIRNMGYKKFSISKYCLAMAYLKNLKKNRFKLKINQLEKILA